MNVSIFNHHSNWGGKGQKNRNFCNNSRPASSNHPSHEDHHPVQSSAIPQYNCNICLFLQKSSPKC